MLFRSKNLTDKQLLWGTPTNKAIAKYYSEFIKNLSLSNLKEQFAGYDAKEMLYGEKLLNDEWLASKGFLELPGRSHAYVKSFIKAPEFAYAHEQLIGSHISKMAEIEQKLKNKDLSSSEREALENEYKKWDLTNEDVMEGINAQALNHARWSILMNNNKFVDKFNQIANREGVTGSFLKSEIPVVKIPTNYVGRYFAVKYGLLKIGRAHV